MSEEAKAFVAYFVDGSRRKVRVPERFTFRQWLTVLGWGKKLSGFKVTEWKK